jgi:hypothetical protein
MVPEGTDAPHSRFDGDLLSDLHGDVLPPDEAARLRAAVADDHEAQQVLAALDRVRDDLAALRTDPAPASAAPEQVMARIRATLESAPVPVTNLADRRRRRTVGYAAAAAAVLAVLGGLTFAVVRGGDSGQAPDNSVLAQPTAAVDLGEKLRPAAALGVLGHSDPGVFSDPGLRAECLRANGIDVTAPVLGSTTVTLHDTAGVLLLLPGPQPPQVTALVVGNSCSATDPATLARTDIG